MFMMINSVALILLIAVSACNASVSSQFSVYSVNCTSVLFSVFEFRFV
jgi:hypothetical protein